jgi:hypothetical protein
MPVPPASSTQFTHLFIANRAQKPSIYKPKPKSGDFAASFDFIFTSWRQTAVHDQDPNHQRAAQ